jgi:hypothetical protein
VTWSSDASRRCAAGRAPAPRRQLGRVTRGGGRLCACVCVRACQVAGKRWKLDINARQEAMLMLSAVTLPGGVQARRSSQLLLRCAHVALGLCTDVLHACARRSDGALALTSSTCARFSRRATSSACVARRAAPRHAHAAELPALRRALPRLPTPCTTLTPGGGAVVLQRRRRCAAHAQRQVRPAFARTAGVRAACAHQAPQAALLQPAGAQRGHCARLQRLGVGAGACSVRAACHGQDVDARRPAAVPEQQHNTCVCVCD